MRVSANRHSPDYFPGAGWVEVRFDGVKLCDCMFADEATGQVVCLDLETAARQSLSDTPLIQATGRVELSLRGDAPAIVQHWFRLARAGARV